ncbi:MAG: alpha amylase C-terminal domain-containing protein [Candidatus Nomurabacteria bacterium]|jgi:1,4-alpha-glucan branching enzyme|nr:alpha amylase C-terminal domain-containing protein [Candidatus Nomurabacteria bacterium]
MDEGGARFGSFTEKYYVEFCFWYEGARKVWLSLGDTDFEWHDHEMISVEPNIWETKVGSAKPGMQYRYKVELENGDSILVNDPYARQLTSSTNGNSVIVDEKFDWGEQNFTPPARTRQIIYEMHIGTFNQPDDSTPGDFDSAIEKLPYLKDLGVNMIEIMPVTSMLDGQGWGYAPIHLFAVEEKYGGHYGLKKFVRAAHEAGMGVIVDIVYNHMHPNTDLPESYFFDGDLRNTDWGPRLNYTAPQVKRYLVDNIRLWIEEYRVDGMRLDFTLGVRSRRMDRDEVEDSIPGGWEILQKMTRVARSINRRAMMIAEDNGANTYLTKPISEQGAGFTAQWGVGFPRALRGAFGINEEQNLGDISNELYRFYNDDWRQKIVFSESHDTAALANGNERLNDDFDIYDPLSRPSRQKMLLAAGITLTAPGIPMLFQGQESMQFAGFSALAPFNWRVAEHFGEVIAAHQHLIDLRLNKYGHTGGLAESEIDIIHTDEDNKILAYTRGGCLVIANFGDKSFDNYEITTPFRGNLTARFNSSWNGYGEDFTNKIFDSVKPDGNGKISVALAEFTMVILS